MRNASLIDEELSPEGLDIFPKQTHTAADITDVLKFCSYRFLEAAWGMHFTQVQMYSEARRSMNRIQPEAICHCLIFTIIIWDGGRDRETIVHRISTA